MPNCNKLIKSLIWPFQFPIIWQVDCLRFQWESMNEVKRIFIVCENNEVTHFGRNPQYYSTD